VNSTIEEELLRRLGLRENPFSVAPNPRYLYHSPTHREALASLITGIDCGCGFQALIALPGMGKTTLLFQLLENFQKSARTAFLFQTQCNSREFLQYLVGELGGKVDSTDFVIMHQHLNEILTKEAQAGRRVIIIIDESQNLDSSVLETVRLLSDFETQRDKLMQIILAGQLQLADKLSHPSLEQLRQRLQIITRLSPLNFEETCAYVAHRVHLAGYSGTELFTKDALDFIHSHSAGIPRRINTLCFNAMLSACARDCITIGVDDLHEAAADLHLTPADA
jgi:general secretion pathway protein A